jgi:glycerophosphoryl diester phosphodiesterase
MPRILNIAHRGGAGLRPENTLSAFRHAAALGADGAELDVQLSADGVVVVHHDYRLNPEFARKGGQWLAGEGPRIKDLTFAELAVFDLGRPRPGSDYTRSHPDLVVEDGAKIPALEEVVRALPESFLLLVELKSSTSADSADPVLLADGAFRMMKSALARTIFVGFDWRGLARIKSLEPKARCWFTTDKLTGDAAPAIHFIKAAGGDGWFPRHEDVTPESVSLARTLGLQIGAWTVNDSQEMRRLLELKLDAICTDRPDILQTLEQRS